MKTNQAVQKLVELRQNGWSRHPHAAPWRARYVDYRTTLTTELRRTRDPDALPRIIDTLVAEIAVLRDRQSIPADAPLRTIDTTADDVPLGPAVDVTVTRGSAPDVVITAIDRLAALLDGDWVVIISGRDLHATVRPAPDGSSVPRPVSRPNGIPGYGDAITTKEHAS